MLRRLAATKEIPTLPQVVHLALSVLDADQYGANEVSEVITQDPALTARVLKIANSVFYNPTTERVATASGAIARIGFDEVRRIVITIGVVDLFRNTRNPFDYLCYWRHCIATGLLAELVSQVSPVVADSQARSGEFFPGGLLHDIGVLPLAAELKERYTRLVDQAAKRNESLLELEQKRFGLTHAKLGGALIERWRIAESIGAAAEHHAWPERAPQPHLTFVRVVHVAEWLADEFGYGMAPSDDRREPREQKQEVWCKLALSRSDIPQLREAFLSACEVTRLFSLLS